MHTSLAVSAVLLLVVAGCGDDRTSSASPSTQNDPTTPNDPTTSAVATTPVTTVPPATTSSAPATVSGTDPADAYLTATTEIYRRELPDGRNFVVRLSSESYATVFGLVWQAPTGSAERCLGDRAVFLGVPGDIGPWGSAWITTAWFDAPELDQPAVLQSSMWAAENTSPPTYYLLVRTGTEAAEIILTSPDGTEIDRSSVSNSLAMVVVDPQAWGEGHTVNDLSVIVVAQDGHRTTPTPLTPPVHTVPAECGPGDPPQRPLPPAGAQPTNPDAAAAQIRQRHALLVDRAIPAGQKPDDLLDDDTGVAAATAALDAGPYKDIAASATYSIDDLVFTQPDEAWFRYTITTSESTYPDRFGTASFNGTVWQISRATICQDLALAQSPCEPGPQPLEPPTTPEWDAAWHEWVSRANLYAGNDGCPPLSQC